MKNITEKPLLTTRQIFNMSVGFLGIQFGFALQNGNASRILQTFGADVEHLSLFWLAAPVTGMIVQPIIGHYSDRTWNRLGRRRPYFLVGAILTALALILMPNSSVLATFMPAIFVGAGLLMIMDASINVAMEPFRALVADNLPDSQRSVGFSIQTFLIGVGAIVGSALPYILAKYFHVPETDNPGVVPTNVKLSFYIGAAVLISAILWTIFTTKEYSPEEHAKFSQEEETHANQEHSTALNGLIEEEKHHSQGLSVIFTDFKLMPKTMKQLGLVQFFSWFALFSMWVYTTPAIAQHFYNVQPGDTSSKTYADAGNWVGVLFSVYNGVAAGYALLLPLIAKRTSRTKTHAFSLLMGGLGLLSFFVIKDPKFLVVPMVGIGLAWGSILAMPYAILAGSLPAKKIGVYMGIFNFFITFPQIINGFFGGWLVKHVYGGHAIYSIIIAGVSLVLGAISVLYVKDEKKKMAVVPGVVPIEIN